LLLLVGWIGATFIGAVVGSSFARSRAMAISGIVGGLVLAATVANFTMIPHPAWVVIAAIAGIAGVTWLAIKLMWQPVSTYSA
jgi:hypothetical protein